MFDVARVLIQNHDEAIALLHGYGDRLLQTVCVLIADSQFVDDHLNVVVLVTIYLHATGNLHQLTIDTDIQVALPAHRLEEFAVVTLAASDEWGEDEDFFVRIVVEDHVEHLLLRIFHHFLACGITVGTSCTGKEQTHIVIDFRRGANGGTWVLISGLLFDADNRGETCDLIHIWPLHATEEITGVSREGFDIAALSFGKDGIEGQ